MSRTVEYMHTVYRFWSADDELLYVGMTMDPSSRWAGHRADKPWWSMVATITLELHPSRAMARRAELNAIRYERPRFNVQDADVMRRRSVTKTVTRAPKRAVT